MILLANVLAVKTSGVPPVLNVKCLASVDREGVRAVTDRPIQYSPSQKTTSKTAEQVLKLFNMRSTL